MNNWAKTYIFVPTAAFLKDPTFLLKLSQWNYFIQNIHYYELKSKPSAELPWM